MLSSNRSRRRSQISRGLLAAFFVGAGVLHFVKPEPYESIMPPQLPYPRELIYISGVAEIAGGIGAQIPQTRRAAGIALIVLLIAIFPANVHMALPPETIKGLSVPRWLLWARLPLQVPMMWHAWRATRDL